MKMLIKEFAEANHSTVRTLHYYDEIGLLCPQIDEQGNRQYGEVEQQRLLFIQEYKKMGLSLQEIGKLLDASGHEEELKKFLSSKRVQLLADIDEEKKRQEELLKFERHLDKEEPFSADDYKELLKVKEVRPYNIKTAMYSIIRNMSVAKYLMVLFTLVDIILIVSMGYTFLDWIFR